MRKLVIASLVTAFWHCGIASAQSKPAGGGPEIQPSKNDKPAAKVSLRRLLRTKIEQVEWDDTPLSEILDWVRERGDINVVARWTVLEPLGVNPDSTVSLKLSNAALGSILAEVLNQLSSVEEIRYQGIGNTLTISSRVDLNRKLYVKSYPVNDLLFRIPEFTDAPAMNIQQTGGGGGAGGGSASQNPFQGGTGGGGGGGDEDTRSRQARIDDLIKVILNTVDPEAWRENGGQASIQAFGDSTIVIRASLELHEKVGGPMVLEE